jgi:hypothetical protein
MAELGRDLGGAAWFVAVGALGVWCALVATSAQRVRPRPVRPGRDAADVVRDESPAVVNLLTGTWSLGREAVQATLLDLAARGHVSIEQSGPGTVVHVPAVGSGRPVSHGDAGGLRAHEQMVLDHVSDLAATSGERTVPAIALTTSPPGQTDGGWRRFRAAVRADAVALGVARPRWSGRRKLGLVLAGAVPALAFGFAAAATFADASPTMTDAAVTAATFAYGALAEVALAVGVVVGLRGVADTPLGRDVAARWLGLRATIARDPRLAELGPSTEGGWGRRLAYAAAMGLAPGAVRELPLATDDRREVWSSAGGSPRVVQVRYPRFNAGYGRHPAWVLSTSVARVALVVVLALALRGAASEVPVGLVLLAVSPFALVYGFPLVNGVRALLDLVAPHQAIEGRVLRLHQERPRTGSLRRWFVVVDAGSGEEVWPWRLEQPPPFGLGAVVRAEVSHHLVHVRNIQVLDASQSVPVDTDHDVLRAVRAGVPGAGPEYDPVMRAAERLSDHAGAAPLPAGGPYPPFPDASEARRVIERAIGLDPATTISADPTSDGRTAIYRVGGGSIRVTWIDPANVDQVRVGGAWMYDDVEGVGDAAYRVRGTGTLLARRGGAALAVAANLPDMGRKDRHRTIAALAGQCLAQAGTRREAL